MGVMFLNLKRKEIYNSGIFTDFADYVARDSAVDKTRTNTIAIEVDSMFGYYAREVASDSVGFDFGGDKSKQECIDEYKMYRPNEIYTGVISLKEFDAKIIGIKTKEDWMNLANKFIERSSVEMNIKRNDLVWGGFYHTNTQNPHIHFYIYSKTKKNLNLLSKKKIMRVRSILGNYLIDNCNRFKEKDLLKNEQLVAIKDYMDEIDLDKLLKQNILMRMANFKISGEDKYIANTIIEASKHMSTRGRLTMNYLEKTNKEGYTKMIEVVDLILKKNEDKYTTYKELLNAIEEDYKIIYGKENKNINYKSKQIKTFKHRIGNEILKEIKKSGIISENFNNSTNEKYFNNYFSAKAGYEFRVSSCKFIESSILLLMNTKTNKIDLRVINKNKEREEKENENG